jgi:precorrin-2 methylase
MEWLARLNPRSRSLHEHYADGEERLAVYARIVDDILDAVRGGANVCVAFYGHPGIFVTPSHEAVRQARAEGHPARMLPAVSAVDCLFADLGVDPASSGCLLYEATDFLSRDRVPDVDAMLVLWQVGALGVRDVRDAPDPRAVDRLVAHLGRFYAHEHPTAVYEASPYPVAGPRIEWTTVGELAGVPLRTVSTLYVPPGSRAAASGLGPD